MTTKKDIEFEVLSINVPWKINKHRQYLKRFRKELSGYPIKIRYIPLLPPIRYCLKSIIYLKLVQTWLVILIRMNIPSNVTLIHCRSYIAAYCGINASKKPVVFEHKLPPFCHGFFLLIHHKGFHGWLDRYVGRPSLSACPPYALLFIISAAHTLGQCGEQ